MNQLIRSHLYIKKIYQLKNLFRVNLKMEKRWVGLLEYKKITKLVLLNLLVFFEEF